MNIKEFFEWLGKECLYPDGTKYFRPEFLWFNKAHGYYEDLVMYQPTFERTVELDGEEKIRTYWDIRFMLTPYANRKEYPSLLAAQRIAIHDAVKEWAGKYSVEEINSTPVEFWFRETENSYVRVKVTPYGKPGADVPYIRKFIIEYDTQND